ncbi:hypothetical protein DY000_02011157 [Brassica cretica]|uniref:Uncharacterized protein n=1 Tax=Brassica cretica TaxID=69181 RepID=A0ABQ7CV15_BRACR|nr:hypothetical protein DY000_02011157 [Brassica cretica]
MELRTTMIFLSYLVIPNMRRSGSMGCSEMELSIKLPLPTFGLASYKLKVSVWNHNRAQECQKISYFQQAADKWLEMQHVL